MLPAVRRARLLADRQALLSAQEVLVTSVQVIEDHMQTCKEECHWMERALGLQSLARIDQLLTQVESELGLEAD